MKKLAKKTKSPKRPLSEKSDNVPQEPSISMKPQVSTSFIQAKPEMESNVVDLSGTWKTCGENVTLTRDKTSQVFEGKWGVSTLRFKLEENMIKQAKLGSMELMFGGKLNHINEIRWGNGQIWTRV